MLFRHRLDAPARAPVTVRLWAFREEGVVQHLSGRLPKTRLGLEQREHECFEVRRASAKEAVQRLFRAKGHALAPDLAHDRRRAVVEPEQAQPIRRMLYEARRQEANETLQLRADIADLLAVLPELQTTPRLNDRDPETPDVRERVRRQPEQHFWGAMADVACALLAECEPRVDLKPRMAEIDDLPPLRLRRPDDIVGLNVAVDHLHRVHLAEAFEHVGPDCSHQGLVHLRGVRAQLQEILAEALLDEDPALVREEELVHGRKGNPLRVGFGEPLPQHDEVEDLLHDRHLAHLEAPRLPCVCSVVDLEGCGKRPAPEQTL